MWPSDGSGEFLRLPLLFGHVMMPKCSQCGVELGAAPTNAPRLVVYSQLAALFDT